jgi:hypothetical protein
MAFDDLNSIPADLKLCGFEVPFKTRNFQTYSIFYQEPGKNASWHLRIDEFECRNEMLVKRNRDLMFCKDIRGNVYAPTVALLTRLPLWQLLKDESTAKTHLERLGVRIEDLDSWRKEGLLPLDAAKRILSFNQSLV